jgi:hypothetical protein
VGEIGATSTVVVRAAQGVRMKPIWDFILSSLRESLSNQSEQSLAGIAIVLILLAVLIPVYLLMKIFRISGTIEVRDPTITGEVLDKLISTGQDTSARQDAQIPESRQQLVRNLESARRSGLEFYKLLTFGITAVLTCIGIYFASIATVANGLILPTIMIFAAAFFVFTGMQKFREMMTAETPEPLSIHFTETERTSEPTVVRMAVSTAASEVDPDDPGQGVQ